MHLVSVLRDPLLMQEARKRFDKASLIYDQVHSQSEIISNFPMQIPLALSNMDAKHTAYDNEPTVLEAAK